MGAELVQSAAFEGDAPHAIVSFEDLRWLLTRGALEGRDVRLLQRHLKDAGLLKAPATAHYGTLTRRDPTQRKIPASHRVSDSPDQRVKKIRSWVTTPP